MPVPHWIYRFRGKLASLPLIFALLSCRWETEADAFIWIFGTAFFLVGLFLRIWAQQHLHYRLKAPMQLTVTGPYALVRNPIYMGNTLICVAATLMSELVWLIPFTLLWCVLLYSLVVRYEEQHLLGQYGESYRKYILEIPRWFPRFSFAHFELINEHLRASIISEIGSTLIPLFFVFKELSV
jgi:protein-S-isoprenylcysteine O-methyltransferase Ste14